MNTPRLIGIYICTALQRTLQLTEEQAYVSVASRFIEGQPPQVVQVVPGKTSPEGGGKGSQEGGALLRRQNYALTLWHQTKMDQHGWSQQALTESAYGVLDFMESIRNVFKFTTLGDLFYEPMKYEGETDTFVFDEDRGIFYRTLTLSGPYGEALPSTPTLTTADVI